MQNELADQIIQERASLKHLRVLLNGLSWSHKIAVVQIASYLISCTAAQRLINILPVEEKFDDQLDAAIKLMSSLPPETLTEIAIEILEEPQDTNE